MLRRPILERRLAHPPRLASRRVPSRHARGRGHLDGQMLIAMPTMGDDRFARSVIYVCAFDRRRHDHRQSAGIEHQLPRSPGAARGGSLRRRDSAAAGGLRREGAQGRPVDTQRGFVLHSSDFFIDNSTLPIDEGICLTATLDISRRSRAATGRTARSRSAGPAGHRASSRTRSSITAGCIARPTSIDLRPGHRRQHAL